MLKVSADADAAAKRPTARIATTPEIRIDLVTVIFLYFRGCRRLISKLIGTRPE
jgi:hypothetical protein